MTDLSAIARGKALKAVTADVAHAAAQAEIASKTRDEVIRNAHAHGATIRAIASEAGLSAARIHQIIHGR